MTLASRLGSAVATAALAMLAAGGTAAAAAPAVASATKPPCAPHGHHNVYPPGLCKAQTSASSIAPGHTLTVSGNEFGPGEAVAIDLHSTTTHLATVMASALGAASARVTIPDATTPGAHTITMTGQRTGSVMTANMTVARADAARPASTAKSGLPFSGSSAAIPLASAGTTMVIGGAVALAAVRRRRRGHAAR